MTANAAILETKRPDTPVSAIQNREWLETNGLGGYASSSLIGGNTRRYHGLLIAALRPPVQRCVLLSKFEETLHIGDRVYELSTNQYAGGTVHPLGFRFFRRFRLDPFPIFTFDIEGVEIEKSIFMVHSQNTTVIEYRITRMPAWVPAVRLEVRPLIAFRDYHSLTHANPALDPRVQQEAGNVSIAPYRGMPALRLAHNARSIHSEGFWYYNFEYGIEKDRGLDHNEDLFSPFAFEFDIANTATVIASTERHDVTDAAALRAKEISRRSAIVGQLEDSSAPLSAYAALLRTAADQFIVKRGEHFTVIAGYHWFCDWGRDTMISLPGLALSTGRFKIAREILLTFAKSVDQGMLPNRFPDHGEAPDFNTVDATLWFFHSAYLYLERTGDEPFIRDNLYPVLQDIIDWHLRGTRHGIKADMDGLLSAEDPGVQLTWMDARIDDRVITPRHGKPVEIQALWFNALRIMETFATRFQDTKSKKLYRALADKANAGFRNTFWNSERNCLYDVVNGTHKDGAIRPNQIFAVSLPFSMLDPKDSAHVMQAVEQHLLTPYGLRTLAPSDPAYIGRYEGGVEGRDGAYHQGTAWPWLLGPFVTAYLKVHGHTVPARHYAQTLLLPILEQLASAGAGQISEVYDGDSPQRPGGCIAQAWSVAEVLRCLVDELGTPVPAPTSREG